MLKPLLALAVLVGIVAAVLWSGGQEDVPEPLSPPEDWRPEANPSESDPRSPPPVRRPEPEEVETAPYEPPAAERFPATPVERPERPRIRLTGTVVAIDEDGAEHPAESGSFELHLFGRGLDQQRVRVEDGRFDVEVPEQRGLSVVDCVLADRLVDIETPRRRFPADHQLMLRGRWKPALKLHVLDRATRAPLRGISVTQASDTMIDANSVFMAHPGLLRRRNLISDATSPLLLAPSKKRQGKVGYWVRAEGYVFGSITVDHASGGERELLLERAGELEVRIQGDAKGRSLWLRPLAKPDDRPMLSVDCGTTAPLLLEGVAPGTYSVEVVAGDWFSEAVSLARAEARVHAGKRTDVTLELPARQEAPAKAPLSGVIVVPSAWSPTGEWPSIELVLKPLGDNRAWAERFRWPRVSLFEEMPGSSEMRRWTVGEVYPGPYEVMVRPLGHRQFIDVPAAGERNARIEVPPPAQVIIVLVDAATGAPITPGDLWWFGERPPGTNSTSAQAAPSDPVKGEYRFTAPAGTIEITLERGASHRLPRRKLRLVAGENRHRIEVYRDCGILLSLLEGEAVVPYALKWRVRLRQIDGEGRGTSGGSEGRFPVSHPGRYHLDVEVPGYDPIRGHEVEIPPGTIVEVTLQLQRSR